MKNPQNKIQTKLQNLQSKILQTKILQTKLLKTNFLQTQLLQKIPSREKILQINIQKKVQKLSGIIVSVIFSSVLALAQNASQSATQTSTQKQTQQSTQKATQSQTKKTTQNPAKNPKNTTAKTQQNPSKTHQNPTKNPAQNQSATPPKSQTPLTSPSRINAQTPHIAYNGTTYIFTSDEENPKPLKFGTKSIFWLAHPTKTGSKIALVSVPYRANLGKVALKEGLVLEVKAANYKKEQITVTDTSKVRPNKEQQERVARELEEANKIYLTRTPKRLWSEKFELPLGSVITSHYGNARIFNGEVKSYHAGTDFRAMIGTPIKAANDGKVALAKERFMSGKSVIIDHGEGIYSAYFHCSELKVQVGQSVKKGEIIALSGDTGRVSGAHLHFSMMIQGVSVDALHFITTLNALFE